MQVAEVALEETPMEGTPWLAPVVKKATAAKAMGDRMVRADWESREGAEGAFSAPEPEIATSRACPFNWAPPEAMAEEKGALEEEAQLTAQAGITEEAAADTLEAEGPTVVQADKTEEEEVPLTPVRTNSTSVGLATTTDTYAFSARKV